MESRVVIIGAGNFGQALALVLRQQPGVRLEFWDKDPEKVRIQRDLTQVVHEASLVFLCVPSRVIREVIELIRSDVSPEAVVISTAKGIQGKLTADQLLEVSLMMGQPWALLSGPMLAAEIQAGQLSFATLAAHDREIFHTVRDVFTGTTARLEYSSDTRGVALAGVLKNVYSIGLGAVQAIGLGHNVRGSLVMQAGREMADVITRLGGRRETAWGLSGLADLIATGFSEHSRNCRVGKELVEMGECQTVSEGVESLPSLKLLLGADMKLYPVLTAISAMVDGQTSAREALAKLLAVKYEPESVPA